MAAGSPAPDIFGALAWSDRVAPAATPAIGPSHDAVPVAAVLDDDVATPPDGLIAVAADAPVAAALPPPRPAARPPARPPLPEPAVVAAAPSGTGFGGLADALEPPAGVSPLLDEFDDLLGVFDGAPTGEVATPATAAAPVATPAASPKPIATKPVAPRRPTPVHSPAPMRRPTPVLGALPRPRPGATPPSIDFPAPGDPAVSAQLASVAEPSSADLSRVASRLDDEPTPRRGMPAVWIALTVMLGGALAYVLATQTDLLSGNVIDKRNAEAQAAAEKEAAAAQAELDAKRVEYGTIEIDSEPKAARVFEMHDGPEARFEHLPIDHEYMVVVTAPGHLPRVRLVKGSELAAPVIVDLDPLPAGAPMPPLAEERPPKLASPPSKVDATLELRSNTPGAQLGLLVGYTPGVKVIDVDVEKTHRYHVVLAGHETVELVIKGRHFEEVGGALVYQETAKLVPLPPPDPAAIAAAGAAAVEDPAEEDAVVVDDDEPAAAPVATPAPSKPASKKKKKKKKKKKR